MTVYLTLVAAVRLTLVMAVSLTLVIVLPSSSVAYPLTLSFSMTA